MKLTKLHIYGFGRFQDYQISLSDERIHIFLGENEAGKSTIMAFIRCILFGFPTRQQSELRYEPRLGGRYGGSISMMTSYFGEVTIERVSGKATGDVKIYFPDGTIGNEAELKLVLGEIDRTIFTGIYSFGATDLQTMEQLNSEEINQFMYGVGISGRNSLLEIEKKTEKTVQSLYKPTGRKPVINHRLKKVADLEEKLIMWRNKLNEHEQLVRQREVLSEKIEKLSEEKKRSNQTLRYYEKLQSISAVVLEKAMYEDRLRQIPAYEPFPEDGIERFEKHQESLVLVEAEMNDLEEKLTQVSNDIENLNVYENVAQLEEDVADIRETGKVYESKREENALLQQQIQYEEQEYELLKEKVGLEGYDETSCETSYLIEQQLNKLIEEEAAIKQQEQILESQFHQAKVVLEEKELQVQEINSQLLTDEARHDLEFQVSNQNKEAELKQRLQLTDEALAQIDRQLSLLTPSKKSSQPFIFMASSLFFLLVGAAFLFFSEHAYIALVSFVIAVFIFLGLKRQSKNPYNNFFDDLNFQKEKKVDERQMIFEELEEIDSQQNEQKVEILKKDDQLRDELFFKKLNLKEAKQNYESVCKQLDQLEIGQGEIREKLLDWATSSCFPLRLTAANYKKMFELVEQLKDKNRKLAYLKNKRETLQSEMEEFETKVSTLCNQLSLQFDAKSYQKMIEKLTQLLKNEKEVERNYERLVHQQNELIEKRKTLQIKRQQYNTEIEKLFNIAQLNSEESFRQKGKAWKESVQINERLRVLKSQIAPLVRNDDELIKLENDVLKNSDNLEEAIELLEKEVSSYWQEEKQLHEQLAELKLKIREIEDGSSYSDALHNFENEKGILKEEVRKWALHRTVQLLIEKSKAVYEKERQPLVIQEATKMFSFMTNNRYHQLFAPVGEQRLFVEREDGLRFEPNELSQGTREQLYLALRWALATVHSKDTAFPVFIDDIFVNFDKKRRTQAIRLLREVAEKHQVIFFTCHPFIASEITSKYHQMST
ncbi:hypothetical protein BKP35_11355 [Anaerobacillus arseniciselenatis]|uniref:YhaN AAA domain-containing protein n=1 Tax=Anaerobacillus arseniciselenatis TaxID=85682 RepID=A0A1S2LJL5_9BACI|nr:AAA family ATPase [Anaerobacillus arseniciselenatis]OIJ11887.1 hypothetical protein BKP35_11355 [Anaerobacillus arseniciselenatis]